MFYSIFLDINQFSICRHRDFSRKYTKGKDIPTACGQIDSNKKAGTPPCSYCITYGAAMKAWTNSTLPQNKKSRQLNESRMNRIVNLIQYRTECDSLPYWMPFSTVLNTGIFSTPITNKLQIWFKYRKFKTNYGSLSLHLSQTEQTLSYSTILNAKWTLAKKMSGLEMVRNRRIKKEK